MEPSLNCTSSCFERGSPFLKVVRINIFLGIGCLGLSIRKHQGDIYEDKVQMMEMPMMMVTMMLRIEMMVKVTEWGWGEAVRLSATASASAWHRPLCS